jgi:hypothetical protein
VALANTGAEKKVSLRLVGREAEAALPGDSPTTLTWRG